MLHGTRTIVVPLAASALLVGLLGADTVSPALRVGVAGHAFDHLGNLGQQADAAAASGATIIYATGLGCDGYLGLPDAATLGEHAQASAVYIRQARSRGIRLVIGYLCATSIVKLETFGRNWSPELRARFRSAPASWRQLDREGKALPSWYGGDYQPACMNHPDWRAYQKFMVDLQLEAGHDGLFFDNPTVHTRGCYCPHCMARFAAFLRREDVTVSDDSVPALRLLAQARPRDFLRFRCTIARDFLAEMRDHARMINPRALVTCNNSLNSVGAFFSQCRLYGYNIDELSQVEDFIVVEDMANQPRVLSDGRTLEYGPTYQMLAAIGHGRPVVAVTIAEADYHTSPNLMRLAQAEAAAHNASYLSWPTWPADQRQRMIAAVRPQANFLRSNESLLNDTRARREVALLLPFHRWVEGDDFVATRLATELCRANVQFEVVSDDADTGAIAHTRIVLTESLAHLSPRPKEMLDSFRRSGGRVVVADDAGWMAELRRAIGEPAVRVDGPPTLRAVVRDQPGRTIVHLLNLHIRRLSSFEDQVTPAEAVKVECRVPLRQVRSVRALTADVDAWPGTLPFASRRDGSACVVDVTLPRVAISTLLVIEE